jgi:hypothetical protein
MVVLVMYTVPAEAYTASNWASWSAMGNWPYTFLEKKAISSGGGGGGGGGGSSSSSSRSNAVVEAVVIAVVVGMQW